VEDRYKTERNESKKIPRNNDVIVLRNWFEV